jgi:hypothetical protein
MDIKYAVYPGPVTLYDGTEITWNAADLAAAYGVDGEPYLTINSHLDIPRGEAYFEYIHLKPRSDNIYRNIMDTTQDDDQVITYGEDFDGSKKYTQETDPLNIDKDDDFRHN